MTDVYTPTDIEIRMSWIVAVVNGSRMDVAESRIETGKAEFDRWLAAHDAEVKAELVKENETLREELQDMSGDFYAMVQQHE